ncbi:hypothetical protein L6452_01665 [Arctium lappa]|uniref:Uncharacterized protein n=1 Tax=Arctium lappa TaxID=4217 RepID=A0ACB9FGR0_ARCLA|nr:hypothetical protein L6452_01665 [Arctium lappa]
MTSSTGRRSFPIWGNIIFRPSRNVSRERRSTTSGPMSLDSLSWVELQTHLHQSCELLKGSREELEKTQESLAAKEKEAKDSKARETELKTKIMRRHLAGKNPLAKASEDLELYLLSVRSAKDLDSDNEMEEEVLEVEDEALVDEASAS